MRGLPSAWRRRARNVRLQRRTGVARGPRLSLLLFAGAFVTCQLIGDIGDRQLEDRNPSGGSAGATHGGSSGAGGGGAGGGGAGGGGIGGAEPDSSTGGGGALGHVQSKLIGAAYPPTLHDLSVDRGNKEVLPTGHFKR